MQHRQLQPGAKDRRALDGEALRDDIEIGSLHEGEPSPAQPGHETVLRHSPAWRRAPPPVGKQPHRPAHIAQDRAHDRQSPRRAGPRRDGDVDRVHPAPSRRQRVQRRVGEGGSRARASQRHHAHRFRGGVEDSKARDEIPPIRQIDIVETRVDRRPRQSIVAALNGPAASTTAKAPAALRAFAVTLRASSVRDATRARPRDGGASLYRATRAARRAASRPARTISKRVVSSSPVTSRRPKTPLPPTTRTRSGVRGGGLSQGVSSPTGYVALGFDQEPCRCRCGRTVCTEHIGALYDRKAEPIADRPWNAQQHGRPGPTGQSA